MYLLVLKQLGIMTVIVLAGFIFAKITKSSEKEQKFLSKLLLYFINPCLVFSQFNMEFDSEKLKQFGFAVFASLILNGIIILISILTTRTGKKGNRDLNHIDRLAIVFTNCGFIGIPLIRGVFGNEGVFFLLAYLMIFNVLLWSWGVYQMSGTINLKKIITNPNIIAVTLGLVLFCMPFTLPEFIAQPIIMIGDMNTATAMILIGVMFADFKYEKSYVMKLLKVVFIRLILCSAINLFVIFFMYKIFGSSINNCYTMLFVVYICSMCPSATSVPSMSCVYNKNTSYASLLVSVTSLICIITIPGFVALAELLFK